MKHLQCLEILPLNISRLEEGETLTIMLDTKYLLPEISSDTVVARDVHAKEYL
jgi:hypothetical protein